MRVWTKAAVTSFKVPSRQYEESEELRGKFSNNVTNRYKM
jgi:hypothetical protein